MTHFKYGFENGIPKLDDFSAVFEHSMVTHFKVQLSFAAVGAITQLLITFNYCYSGMIFVSSTAIRLIRAGPETWQLYHEHPPSL